MRIETITWDGNTEGLTSATFEDMGITFYRVSAKLIPIGEIKITMENWNSIQDATTEIVPGFVMLPDLVGFSAKAGEYDMGDGTTVNISESGTYFFNNGYSYPTSASWETDEPEEPEEPTAPIGYIEYLVNPKYHMGKPFRGIIGWKMAQKGGSADGEPALVSSDGYTLQDVNGLNLIPKEGK